ncbi:outer membrane beta-barrel protein [Sediminibacterium soli]|uniref:outer membrane beta-barrel protein n=1 Tax=Sediminibacterium soli TaxID=2698829 RepID=UPI001379C861|nr:outer membrane beta-barrel protein [Sediminibacterium soli]NCI47681.1 outer membrane beta-barrel protein [Sediminibacterium soli]
MNGKRVNRILVDGKSFFGSDTRMATKNLPSEFIDKVQVTDDKDEIARNNDGDLSNAGKVINLTMKKHIKRKWFGKLSGGLGTDERYTLNASMNILRDTFQLNMLGSANNFSGNGQGFTPATNQNASVNFNYTRSKSLSFSGQYAYRANSSDLFSRNETQRFIGDTVVITHSQSQSLNSGGSHNVSLGGNWRADSLTNLDFRISYGRNENSYRTTSQVLIDNNFLGSLSRGNNLNRNGSTGENINQTASISYRFRKHRGRSVSFSESFSYNYYPSDMLTESNNELYYPAATTKIINQLRSTNSPSTLFSATGTYSDQLTKKWTLRANSRFEYSKRLQDLLTYARGNSNKYDSLDNLLSNSLNREHMLWSNMVGLGYRINKVTVSLNGTWTQQWVDNHFGIGGLYSARQYYSNLFPSLTVNWARINFTISQNLSVPNIGQLTPVPDNSNPYYIRYGNPDLLPTKQTSFNLNGSIYNVKTSFNVSGNLNASFTNDAVIQKSVLSSSGVQTSIPVNADGLFSSYAYLMASKQFRSKQKFFLTLSGSLSANISRSPIYFNGVQTIADNLNIGPSLTVALDWNERVLFNPRYTINVNKSSYSSQQFNKVSIVTHDVGGDITLRPTKKIILQSNASYRYNGQFASGSNRSIINWNASVSTLLFKESQAQLKLDIYDVLNNSSNFYSFISANSIVKGQSTVLQRFFMLSFVYNIKPVTAARPGRALPGPVTMMHAY